MIEVVYMDMDSIPYVGASIAEKPKYQFFKKDGTEQSEMFPKAALAKEFMERLVGFNEEDPNDWERKVVVDLKPESVAFKGMDYDLKGWIKTAKRLTGNPLVKMVGYLTCSGVKNKDVEHLEHRYQHNRYASRTPKNLPEGYDKHTAPWVALPRPTHLKSCRSHLQVTEDWVKMSPPKIEADAPIVFLSEKRGMKAAIMSKDKDLGQGMGTYFIDMNPPEKDRVLVYIEPLGIVNTKSNAKGVKSLVGYGFKLILAQTMVGDTSDGYKGITGYGAVTAFDLLKDLNTPEECCEAVLAVYEKKFHKNGKGHSYIDWTGKPQNKTWQEMAIQHCQLAYHERGSKDTSNPLERHLNGENPIYKHGVLQ